MEYPHCGGGLRIVASDRLVKGDFQKQGTKTYTMAVRGGGSQSFSSIETPPMPGTTWERREPGRTPQLRGDVAVPLAQAGVTGIVFGVASGLLFNTGAGVAIGG